jgi:hypothetical protein
MSSSTENVGTAEASIPPVNGNSFFISKRLQFLFHMFVCVKIIIIKKIFRIERERIMQFHCRALNFVHCRLCECIYTIERYLAPAW